MGTLHAALYTLLIVSRSIFLRTRNVSDQSCRENQNTHFILNNFLSRKPCSFWDNVEKCSRAGEATDDNIVRRFSIICWKSKATNTDSEYVTHLSFSTGTMLTRTRPDITLYVYCLSCYVYLGISMYIYISVYIVSGQIFSIYFSCNLLIYFEQTWSEYFCSYDQAVKLFT